MKKIMYSSLAIIFGSIDIYTAEAMLRASSSAEPYSVKLPQSATTSLPQKVVRVCRTDLPLNSPQFPKSPATPTTFAQNLYHELYRRIQTPPKPRTNYVEQQGWRQMTPAEILFLKNAIHPWIKSGIKCYLFGVIDKVGAEMLNAWMLIPELRRERSPLTGTESTNAKQTTVPSPALIAAGKDVLKLLENGIPYNLILQHYKEVQTVISELPSELHNSAHMEIWLLLLQGLPFELIQQEYLNVQLFMSAIPQPRQAQATAEIWSLLHNNIPFRKILQEYVRVNEIIFKQPLGSEETSVQHCRIFAEFWTLLHYGMPFSLITQEYANVRKFISNLRGTYFENVHESVLYTIITDIWHLLYHGTPFDLINREYLKVWEFTAKLTPGIKRNSAQQLLWCFLRNETPFERAVELYTQIHNTAILISKDNPHQLYMILAHSIAPNESQLVGKKITLDGICCTLDADSAIKVTCDGDINNMRLITLLLQNGVNVTKLEIQNANMFPFPDEVITSLCEVIKSANDKLKVLNLSDCSITNAQMRTIARALKDNTSLSTLNLSGNSIWSTGAKNLTLTLKKNKTLTHLHLDANYISDEYVPIIIDFWESHPALIYLNLQGNRISPQTRQELERAKPAKMELVI